MARLTALERERADVVAEINTLRSMQSENTEPIKVAWFARAKSMISSAIMDISSSMNATICRL